MDFYWPSNCGHEGDNNHASKKRSSTSVKLPQPIDSYANSEY